MAQFSTGLGLAVLGSCILGAAAIPSHRLGGEAFAQGTGGERRVVSAFVQIADDYDQNIGALKAHYAYRIWSDNTIDVRLIGATFRHYGAPFDRVRWVNGSSTWGDDANLWTTRDNGTSAYLRADVDESRTVDAGDIGAVLLDFGKETGDPPPPIDCTINAPR